MTPKISVYWLSNKKMTVKVILDENDTIIDAAPILFKFIGQPIINLTRWLSKFGETKGVKLQ
jgi:hypothetical protein